MTYRPYWILAPLILAGIAPFQTGHAQTSQADLVRPLGAADLNSNLARLASNPRDVNALIGAGEAALALDDPRAAAGFFARADAIQSGNGRIKAGLGRVMVKLQNPAEALRLFDQATRMGYPDSSFLSDRGLARDMTGDQANAQRDYQAALAKTPEDPELLRRYAASLGISGQIEASDNVLKPLLYKSDRAAWRYRAFILAMNNKQNDAKKIAEQTLPAPMVASLTPYMQKMPYLTPAQKAAAVHFGHFPTTVGTTIAAVVPTAPAAGVSGANVGGVAQAQPAAGVQLAAREASSTRRRDRTARQVQEAPVRNPAQATGRAVATGSATAPVMVQPLPGAANSAVRAADVRGRASRRGAAVTVQPTPAAPMIPATQGNEKPSQSVATTPANPVVQPLPNAARADVQVARARATPPVSGAPSPPASTQSVPAQSAPSPAASQPTPSQSAARTIAPVQGPPAPGFETLDDRGSTTPPVSTASAPVQRAEVASAPAPAASQPAPTAMASAPTPAPSPPAPDPAATRTLADIIRAIDVPDSERQPSVAAVDLAEIEALQAARRATRQAAADKVKKAAAAKAKAEADAKAKAEAAEKARLAANPSRNWLQIATGANKGALSFTLNGLRKKYPELAPQDAWIASWGRTNRLVVGPFPSFARAQALEKSLKADGADVFAWKSDVGEDVTRLK
ncbi:SPOR domain-containing protein [Sphingobium aromaticiconvertens]|uniref:SPOR domain-containing protein n=1 Tax=Sphingobium aromaticiconvertens TaxID=365341 RepID=UPI003AFAE7DF